MEHKTKVHAQEGRQDLTITREFNLPLNLLFKAHAEPAIVEQWMGTKVLKYEPEKHGSYRFKTADAQGNILFSANGVFHDFDTDSRITRTFEMENAPFGVQLEFYEFESLTETTSRLTIHSVFRSAAQRDAQLKLPFAFGLNMAHNRLEEIAGNFKTK